MVFVFRISFIDPATVSQSREKSQNKRFILFSAVHVSSVFVRRINAWSILAHKTVFFVNPKFASI